MPNYRPAPFELESNYFLEFLIKQLKNYGWTPVTFKYWRVSELFKNRKKCEIIYLHWPEAFWRSNNKVLCWFKAFRFIFIFYVANLMGYKWAFSAHNVIPHYKVHSYLLERVMRYFILKNFDLVIGHAYNTKNDLELAFGTSGKKYALALHGTYENCYPIENERIDFRREHNLPEDAKIILIINTLKRENKGLDELTNAWLSIKNYDKVHLLVTGIRPANYETLRKNRHFHFIEGRIPNKNMGNLLNAVDFMFLNYKNITTSGMFFLSVTFNLPIITSNIPFFKLHSSEKTAIFFDYNQPLIEQIDLIITQINDAWRPDVIEFSKLRNTYKHSISAKIINRVFNEITNSELK